MQANITNILYCVLTFPLLLFSQNLLNQPESIVFNAQFNRYLVCNFATGDIVQIDSAGEQSYFSQDENCFTGVHIHGGIVYAACRAAGVKGFDLASGELVFDLAIEGAEMLNDITTDTSGNLYVSDPRANRICRINLADETWTVFATQSLYSPNGLFFDAQGNRLLVCSSRDNSPVQAVYLSDSSVSTIINTDLDILDGFTMDSGGNYYISSWGNNAVYKFDNAFENMSRFSRHDQSPADIFFDREHERLAVPIFYGNRIDFVDVPRSVRELSRAGLPDKFSILAAWPNPFNSSTNIEYIIPIRTAVTLRVFNSRGQIVDELLNQVMSAGAHSIRWETGSNVPDGLYFVQLQSPNHSQIIKITHLK